MKNHLEADCFKKHPDKAPQWFKDLKDKLKAAGANVEIMIGSVEYEPDSITMNSIETEKKAIF